MKEKYIRTVSMKNNNLLIIGKTPPPIGGVTIHVQRLIDTLEKNHIKFRFEHLSKKKILPLLFLTVIKKRLIHLHSSSPYIRFVFAFLCSISKTHAIITYHGNIGRFNNVGNWFDKVSIKFSSVPIVLNTESLKLAQKINVGTILIPAFIPPVKEDILPSRIKHNLEQLKSKCSVIFCTNAYRLSFDKDKNEIYCGSLLVKLFSRKENQQYGLIFSDPSGSYKRFFEQQQINLSKNIHFISEPHSFFEILKFSDCFLRATTTDGDPLSVKEALFLNKKVIASDVIKRPSGCITFNWQDIDSLQEKIHQINGAPESISNEPIINGAEKIIQLYNNFLSYETNRPRPEKRQYPIRRRTCPSSKDRSVVDKNNP